MVPMLHRRGENMPKMSSEAVSSPEKGLYLKEEEKMPLWAKIALITMVCLIIRVVNL